MAGPRLSLPEAPSPRHVHLWNAPLTDDPTATIVRRPSENTVNEPPRSAAEQS